MKTISFPFAKDTGLAARPPRLFYCLKNPNRKRQLFDIEANNLFKEVSIIWCLVILDIDTGEMESFTDFDDRYNSIDAGLGVMDQATDLYGHNIINYDLPVLKVLKSWEPSRDVLIWDTWVWSQMNSFKRSFTRLFSHSLGDWGKFLGFPKGDFNGFSQYSEEMLAYCQNDVILNWKVAAYLHAESDKNAARNPLYWLGVWVEMRFATITRNIEENGWHFELEKAKVLLAEMHEKIDEIKAKIEPELGLSCKAKLSKKEFSKVKRLKSGIFDGHTAKWFDIPQHEGLGEDHWLAGDYCRVSFEPAKIGTDEDVKRWLYRIGWVPDEWNTERIKDASGKWKVVKKSAKLTETSLALLGEWGEALQAYNTLDSRRGILQGWIDHVESGDGRLHGRVWTIGTPSFRCRHEMVANLPSADEETLYGPEMRGLLTAEPGLVVVGADSSGNQMRGLCHYIGNPEFTAEVTTGDVHTRNSNVLSEITPTTRKKAKPFLYAYLFGAAGGKLALILVGTRDDELGNKAKARFESSIPGLPELKNSLGKQYNKAKDALGKEWVWIRGIDGRKIFVDSPHKLLNYLLQTLEAVTCKAAIVYAEDAMIDEGIDHYFSIHYHDEMATVTAEENGERVKEISIEGFTEAPKWFGVECMGGDGSVGADYASVH